MELVRHLPANFPAAVLVVLHLHPESPGMLPRLLARNAQLPVVAANNFDAIHPGKIYIARADCHLLVQDGHLRLGHGPKEHFTRPAVDPLFRSAAECYGPRVIGVVLSGAGSNGTLGLMAIKHHGGITMAQDPDEALWPSMPSSAILRLHVDYVLPVRQLAEKLARLVAGTDQEPLEDPVNPGNEFPEADFGSILAQIEPVLPPRPTAEAHRYPALGTCPECGAVMWPLEPMDLALFRCEMGHVVSGDELMEGQSEALELALWTAVRLCDQKSMLAHHLAQVSDRVADRPGASALEAQAQLSAEAYETLRNLIQRVRLPHEAATTGSKEADDA